MEDSAVKNLAPRASLNNNDGRKSDVVSRDRLSKIRIGRSDSVPRSQHDNIAVNSNILPENTANQSFLSVLDVQSLSDLDRFFGLLHQKFDILMANTSQTVARQSEILVKMQTYCRVLDKKTNRVDGPVTENMQQSIITLYEKFAHLAKLMDQIDKSLVGLDTKSEESLKLMASPKAIEEIAAKIAAIDQKKRNDSIPNNAATTTTPKLFAKLPQIVAESNLPKPELMRLSTVYELIETEKQLRESKLLPESEISNIFSNTDQLILANQVLLQKMLERREKNPFINEIGDTIADSAEGLKVYKVYAANYPYAMKLIQILQSRPDGKEFLTKLMNAPEARGLSLESFLIKPVQRICKQIKLTYPLLLRELEKHSEKAGNTKDLAFLKTAAEKIEAVVLLVNEATRAAEEKQRILNIESAIETPVHLGFSDKKYLKDGNVLQVIQGKQKERFMILFLDILVICRPLAVPKGHLKYELESGFALPELVLKQEPSKGGKQLSIQLQIITSPDNQILQFFTYTEEDRTQWIQMFQRCFKDITEEHRSAVRNNLSQRQSALKQQNSLTDAFGLSMKKNSKLAPSGLSSTVLRKQQETRKTLLGSSEELHKEPEIIEVNGQIYKRALSATGHYYFINTSTKTSVWRIPDESSPVRPTESVTQSVSGTENSADEPNIVLVDGFPDWRRVECKDGTIYYFNINTQETQWDLPEIAQ